ncbi:sigma-70 family RNA polymerase sigma factor [Mesomycoplasma hyorhinis]|uniref:sigma-70 family RNA polymerase sigma factor n=1 Tax=Mesomycoplasma hyorhinis TaxID=2100 RepID=UPI001C051E99|nr:sigma-70 family RNA polymerase sigma factor [Mesomycoplasma hyorhinis]
MKSKYHNKLIWKTYNQYKHIFVASAKSVIKIYNNIPLNWEDLVNYSLFNLVDIVNSYDKSQQHSFEKYLFYKVKYLMINYSKKYVSKSHQVLNLALNYEEYEFEFEDPNSDIYEQSVYSHNEPKQWLQKTFDITNDLELEILVHYFFSGFKTKQISSKTNVSPQKINIILKEFKKKIDTYIL